MKHTSTWTNLKINKTFDSGQWTIHNSYINGYCIALEWQSGVQFLYVAYSALTSLKNTVLQSHQIASSKWSHSFLSPELQREGGNTRTTPENYTRTMVEYGFTKTEPLLTQKGPLWEFFENLLRNESFHVSVMCPGPIVLLTQVFVIFSCGIFLSLVSIKTSPELRKIWRMQFTVMFKELTGIVESCYEQLWKTTWNLFTKRSPIKWWYFQNIVTFNGFL